MSKPEFKVGQRWDIVFGEWVQNDESGQFPVVAENNIEETICAATGVLHSRTLVGKPWRLRTQDCIMLSLDYFDENHGTEYAKIYSNLSGDRFRELLLNGVHPQFDEHPDWVIIEDVNSIQKFDILVYHLNNITTLRSPHIAIAIGDNKIATMLPRKLSSVDPLELDKVIRVYRNIRYA